MFYTGEHSNLVGGLKGLNNGITACITKLQETFDSEKSLNYLTDIATILQHNNLNESYMDILMEDYSDANEDNDLLREMHMNNYDKLSQLMENAREEILSEYQMSGSLKPVVGLTLPLLKIYWIKNIFKDFISTQVATEPSVKIGIKKEYLEDMDGNRYPIPDVFIDENIDLGKLGRQKLVTDPITVPQVGYDLITQTTGGSRDNQDQVSRLFFIDTIEYEETPAADPNPAVNKTLKVRVKVDAGTGAFKYTILNDKKEIVDILMGDLDYETGLLNLACINQKVKSITVDGYLSSENHLRTVSTGWTKEIKQFDIPDGVHFSTGLTEEMIKDEKVIYNVDSTSRALTSMNDSIAQFKDRDIRDFLFKSRERIRGTKLFQGVTFDIKPPTTLNNITNTQWVKQELKETVDRLCLSLSQILQNEEVALSIIGHPLDIRTLADINWMYGKDSEVGGCKLGYEFGLYNNQRNIIIGSTVKMPQGKLMVLLTPMNEEQITYKLFEYQFFISNEYRDPKNVRIKSVMASSRYLVDEVTPVQGEVVLLNNEISSSDIFKTATDPSHP